MVIRETIHREQYLKCRAKTVVITEGRKRVPIAAFAHSKKLRKVVIPSSTRLICPFAFYGCKSLESVEFGKSGTSELRHIYCKSFYETNLKEVILPNFFAAPWKKGELDIAFEKHVNIKFRVENW
ncbi:MAG: leucine-rich repeat domain-containing protein [Treponema sp.]|nr:leucine-rich repeat domain-containing protein [Treponema sp.]